MTKGNRLFFQRRPDRFSPRKPIKRTPNQVHFINPDRPVVIAMMHGAVLLLQEYKSMDVTSSKG